LSRLADRMLLRCEPARLSLMIPLESAASHAITRGVLGERGLALSGSEYDSFRAQSRMLGRDKEPIGVYKFIPEHLRDTPIFAADDVGAYTASLPVGTAMQDVVSCMAPPFDKFFIEFQRVPNVLEVRSWGVLFEVEDNPDRIQQFPGDEGKPRWELITYLFLERDKGEHFGPVASHAI